MYQKDEYFKFITEFPCQTQHPHTNVKLECNQTNQELIANISQVDECSPLEKLEEIREERKRRQMGNKNVCLGEIQNIAPLSGSPDTKWKRIDLKSGSCVQTLVDKTNKNYFKMVQCDPGIPYYKNEHSGQKWAQAIATLKNADDIQTTINLLSKKSLISKNQYFWDYPNNTYGLTLLTNGQTQLSYEQYVKEGILYVLQL